MKKTPVIPKGMDSKYKAWHFSPAVKSGKFVFVSGCTGTLPDGTNSADIKTQFRQAFKNVQASLEQARLGYDDVVEMTTYHVGLRDHLEEFMQAKDEFIKEPYPAWTAIGVCELAVEGALIEIKVTARV